jgi:D-sedoheptulose 7-phosphate isomerase
VDFEKYATEYVSELEKALDSLPKKKLGEIVEILKKARDSGKQVFVFGNGGSAATASHLANDLAKGTIQEGRKRFRVTCLSDNIPLMLAWANDTSFENVFVEQLKNLLNPGDVVIGISGSGNSLNVLKTIEYANENGAVTIGLSGMGGGKLKKLAKHSLVVESNHMGKVEDIHLILAHLIAYHLKGA